MDVRAVAFYLPQFHPIPENDEWWGKGFTEWHNVTRAAPLFRGHYQPHLPADLGFYDLRLAETRELQAQVARAHGIHGFCYWHYWFEGRRLLERPFDDVLASGKPELPFCLAWANESWSRRWLGEEMALLAEQTYSASDDLGHARWLLSVLADARAIRVHGRPLFLIYRPRHLPDPRRTTDVIRYQCVRAGLPDPYLVGIDAHCPGTDCREIGFDGTLRFEPQLGLLPLALDDGPSWARLRWNLRAGVPSRELKVYDYVEARRLMNARRLEHPYFPTVFVGWDNTPRRGRAGVIVTGNTPERFGRALEEAVETVTLRAREERLIFVNAWNEWAEGNHLEPDQKTRLAHLERLRETIAYAGRSTNPSASASSALR